MKRQAAHTAHTAHAEPSTSTSTSTATAPHNPFVALLAEPPHNPFVALLAEPPRPPEALLTGEAAAEHLLGEGVALFDAFGRPQLAFFCEGDGSYRSRVATDGRRSWFVVCRICGRESCRLSHWLTE